MREKGDRLNFFYTLENHARGKLANDILLIFEGQQWTYAQAYQSVLKYGTWLRGKYNVQPKEIVAMNFMNSEKFIFVWFGLWSIGAKPAFINYNLTGKGLAHCIRVSTARLILVDPQVEELVTSEVRKELPNVEFIIFLSELEAEVEAVETVREQDWTRSEDKSQNMAQLVFTSGTTGLPKPAIVSWSKVNIVPILFPGWTSFAKPDVFYTVI